MSKWSYVAYMGRISHQLCLDPTNSNGTNNKASNSLFYIKLNSYDISIDMFNMFINLIILNNYNYN